ncbi:MAG TPA: 1,4-alpha-glucan branching protein GlgB [Bryobacteraceae bacterium]|jgi:1,4-alpha-glucan branching enzyme|nr:1,4-alpha-glucan branching protein GlgB [Bryobacteraceae bacterium]
MALLTPFELHLHAEGTLHESYRSLGAHVVEIDGVSGVRFAVWAPNARWVSVVGDFNDWSRSANPMRWDDTGIWQVFVPGAKDGQHYKYIVISHHGWEQWKIDPYAFFAEVPPRTASIVWRLDNYEWTDDEWMAERGKRDWVHSAISVYEVHLESWMRSPSNEWLTYRQLAVTLVEYVKRMGYTHIELLPITEHPFSGSWGYQVSGYYSPTSRFGTPDDFRFFIDSCHRAGLGVILDWVPAHFPRDTHALARFDGSALYEHEDPRRGEHRDWGTLIFNYGRNEVKTFLLSNALYWLKEFHIDGLRVDAVASMLKLDFSREPGDWEPNQYGGNENLAAIDFLRRFNELTHLEPGAFTVAEESTHWHGVTKPVYMGGLGFTFKWNMGWMHDMFDYFKEDPIYRRSQQQKITFSMLYAFTENFVLPVSHDEVVHLKRSLVGKMPGDEWQRFANARAFLGYMYTHPGKKLLFMGTEIGQTTEWDHENSLPWHLLVYPVHAHLQTFVKEINWLYRSQPALYQVDDSYAGFEWIDFRDTEASTISFLRFAKKRSDFVVVCCNFTPVPRHGYRIGVPVGGYYQEIFNSDAGVFGGSNVGNSGGAWAHPYESHGRPHHISITLPPLAVVVFKLRW